MEMQSGNGGGADGVSRALPSGTRHPQSVAKQTVERRSLHTNAEDTTNRKNGGEIVASSIAAVQDRVRKRLLGFFITCCSPPEAIQVGGKVEQPTGRTMWAQQVDVMMLLQHCPELGDMLYDDTTTLLDLLRAEVASIAQKANPTITAQSISIRLTHVPSNGAAVPSLPSTPEGRLVTACGSVVRISTKRVVPSLLRLMCRKCRSALEIPSSPFNRGGCVRERCRKKECKGEELQVVGQVWMDYAECRLQQRTDVTGRLPRSLLVSLDDDLSIKCNVGQLVEVVGILHSRWKNVRPNSRPVIEPAIWAINVIPVDAGRGMQSANEPGRRRSGVGGGADNAGSKFNPEAFAASFLKNPSLQRVSLVRSVCPQLSGLFGPKLSLLLAAVGGASTAGAASGGMHIRSTIHCLFVGDPSTGKSQLLQYAASIAPRSTSTNGIGSTSAGLTVAATKENGEWVLEPGALVLSDGGVCVIDELRTVSPADRASLHEAMEQQTISVAKAGLVTKLRTVCSVISACNPPFKKNGTAEIGVGGPLLSRFDFVFLLWDEAAEEKDDRIATHILSCSIADLVTPLSQEDVARYVWWVRSHYAKTGGPLLTDGAADLISRYYDAQRRRGASPSLSDAVPVTIRLLESIVRITQAHAKLLLQSECTEYDAAMAILLLERSAHSLKCPLDVLGDGIYTSSRVLDDLFLDDSSECIDLQQQVLDAIIAVFSHFGDSSAHSHGPLSRDETPGVSCDIYSGGECERLWSHEEQHMMSMCAQELPGHGLTSNVDSAGVTGHNSSHSGCDLTGGEDGEMRACSQLLAGVTTRPVAILGTASSASARTSMGATQSSAPSKRGRTVGHPDGGGEFSQRVACSLRRLEEDIRTPEARERRVVCYTQASASPHRGESGAWSHSEVDVLRRCQQPAVCPSSGPLAQAQVQLEHNGLGETGSVVSGDSSSTEAGERRYRADIVQSTPRTVAAKRSAADIMKSLMFRM